MKSRLSLIIIFLLILSFFSSISNAESTTSYLVKFKQNHSSSSNSLRSHISTHLPGTEIQFLTDPQTALIRWKDSQQSKQAIEEFRKSNMIEYIEEDAMIFAHATPNDPSFGRQWALNSTQANIGAENSWDQITDSRSILISIIDSGCNYNHEEIRPNIWNNPEEIAGNNQDDDGNGKVDDIHGYDFQNSDSEPLDDFEHGSLVFGIIGAAGNNQTGISGISWRANIMCLKVLDENGNSTISKAVEAIDYSIAKGVKIINMSWGYTPTDAPSLTLEAAIQRAQEAGILLIASAGNGNMGSGQNNDDIRQANFPASYSEENIISVAAIDQNNKLAPFSNYGANTVDIAAPGIGILSTHPFHAYDFFTGTSAAAPHITGAAALVWAMNPNLNFHQIKRLVLETGTTSDSLENKILSGGHINIEKALRSSPAMGGNLLDQPSSLPNPSNHNKGSSEEDASISSQGSCNMSSQETPDTQCLSWLSFLILLGLLRFTLQSRSHRC